MNIFWTFYFSPIGQNSVTCMTHNFQSLLEIVQDAFPLNQNIELKKSDRSGANPIIALIGLLKSSCCSELVGPQTKKDGVG